MRRTVWLPALLILAATVDRAAACSFCGGPAAARLTLREQFRQARFVARGKLHDPRFDDAAGGSTGFKVERVLKPDPAITQPELTLPKYLPVVGDTSPDYLVFCAVVDGKPDPVFGLPATDALADYLAAAAKLDPPDRLGFAFRHLDSPDPAVAADAYLEFAKATDAEIARARLDPGKLRKLVADPKTPADRLAVFALMLGSCGGPDDAAALAALLDAAPPPDRVRENLGGLLAGLTLLAPAAGWSRTEALLTDGKRPFADRLAAVAAVRFFQSARPAESKPHVLKCYRGLVAAGDLADVAIDDLRRWGWWDLTADVLAAFDRPTHAAPIVRRGVVRYALQAPGDDARAFVAALRAKDPKLVAGVEETLPK